ncbi:C4-dicarboxylate TRAP transporter substrate-binding protein [Sulfitobacter sp. TSTF-M16]|uniref:C4-dicarboxylate TRAP transporter substrate-binding protein n=2 Tax=Sulfitobacter aestuariivivens TaxID=2766981 RepID=A0A927D4M4_9RHOB|nr:C4-dicarboxylate TRAP transporter substrate-binding protein [Sulfitobacter aestuariivivens]MBD3664894.1 C4-dicarboxylate TRAP transporter substrate-binding protein [Sulfitobacter aestuariivivens]
MSAPAVTLADDFNATVAAGHPAVFRWVKMIDEAFAPGIATALEGSGHSMTLDGQYGGAIAKVGEELETVEAGLAEIGICQSLFDPAKLAVQNVTYYTPFVSDDPRLVSELMDDLHGSDPRMTEAYTQNGVVYLGGPVGIDDYLLMTTFPVESLADLDGKKIAAPGPAINWLSGTGAVGVSGNLTTYYNELKAGVYDGVIVFASAALPGKLYEVAPNITRAGLGAQYAGALCANADWYDDLPQEVQAALNAGADAAKEWYLSALEGAVETSFKVMGENGATITDASDEMRAAWAAGMDNAAKSWAEGLDATGVPGTEVLALYMNAMRDAGATPLRDWDKE